MAVSVELWDGDSVVDGVETWWDDIERCLESVPDVDCPILESINPYGETDIAFDRTHDLALECRRLAPFCRQRTTEVLMRIADLCDRADSGPGLRVRFDGD